MTAALITRRACAGALRVIDDARLMRIAAGGGPTRVGDAEAIYCTRCGCRRNGWVDEPNHHDEGCSDDDCLCHDEEL